MKIRKLMAYEEDVKEVKDILSSMGESMRKFVLSMLDSNRSSGFVKPSDNIKLSGAEDLVGMTVATTVNNLENSNGRLLVGNGSTSEITDDGPVRATDSSPDHIKQKDPRYINVSHDEHREFDSNSDDFLSPTEQGAYERYKAMQVVGSIAGVGAMMQFSGGASDYHQSNESFGMLTPGGSPVDETFREEYRHETGFYDASLPGMMNTG